MADIVLSSSNRDSYGSSIWSCWAGAPFDLQLVAKDGTVGAHSGMLLPCSRTLVSIVGTLTNSGPTQILLAGANVRAVAAAKKLVYTGSCVLEEANLLEVLDVFGALGIEVTEGQLRIENSSSNAGSRQFWANPGENLRSFKESAASEVLNIVSGPGIQVTADVVSSENGNSIACSRPHLDVLDLGQGVQSEAVSSDTKGNTKEMKAGGVGARKELKELVKQNGVKQDNLCLTTSSGEGEARKELTERVKQNHVEQYQCTISGKAYSTEESFGSHVSRMHRGSGRPGDLNYVVKNEVAAFDVTEKMGVYDGENNLCSTLSSGEGEPRKELAELVKQNGVKQYQCTICGKAYLTKNSFGVHVSRRHRGSGRARDLLNYVFKNEVAAFDEGSTPGTLPSNSQENLTPGLVFPSFERMQDAIKEWSDANFSPLIKGPRDIIKVKKNLHNFLCANALVKTIKRSAGLRKRTDRLKRADCPVMVEARSNEDGSWTITKAVLEHKGHEVSEELYRQYIKSSTARKLTSEQEDAVLTFLIEGGKLSEVAKMLSDFTDGILNGRFDVYNVVNRLKKKNMVVNIETGQKMVEFKGVQVPAEGLGLTQFQKNSGRRV